MENISLETCKSYKHTCSFALIYLLDLQLSREIFPIFNTKDGLIFIYSAIKLCFFYLFNDPNYINQPPRL